MRRWTQEEHQKQSQLIYEWKPWNKSKGAVTQKGKEISKMNLLENYIGHSQSINLYCKS